MSLISFSVIDVATAEPLQGATVSVNGAPITQTDRGGAASVNAETVDTITVSYTGYNPFSLMAGQLEDDGQLQLSKVNSELPAAIVTAKKNKIMDNSLLGLMLIGGVAFASTQKKGIGAVRSNQTNTLLIVGAGLAAVYFITRKPAAAAYPAAPAGYPAPYPQSGSGQPSTGDWITAGINVISKIFSASGSGTSGGPGTTDWSAV